MANIKRVCVFCGSSAGNSPAYRAGAVALGEALARHDLELVYGGTTVGLMGTVADTVRAAGGSVTGVIPEALVARNIAHPALTDLRVVRNMHERKNTMSELSDAFIALPGGFGTLEELFEALTWLQLGIHAKPCGLLNLEGYFNHLLQFLQEAQRAGFIREHHVATLLVDESPDALLSQCEAFVAPTLSKWA
jgi:uncharacterized protein (TIGR00730 family)